jgi:antitoxin component YwqK of YwqJK toxin-antitoxin module
MPDTGSARTHQGGYALSISYFCNQQYNQKIDKSLHGIMVCISKIKYLYQSFLLAGVLNLNYEIQAQDKNEYYATGELRATGQVNAGHKEGEWRYFYPNGKKNAIESYSHGQLNGIIYYFYPDEILQGKETWDHGTLTDSAWYYHRNGSLQKKGMYKKSEYTGTWFHFFENANVERIVNYINGLPNGLTLLNNEQGVRLQEGYYKDGQEDGEWKFYSQQGELEFTGHYAAGKPTGIWYQFAKGKKKIYKRY